MMAAVHLQANMSSTSDQLELDAGFGVLPGAEGIRAFTTHYTTHRFAGRHEELASLAAWHHSDAKHLLVIAPAGLGKSALVHRWATQLSQHARVVWLPISVRFGTSSPSLARDLLAAKLTAHGVSTTGDWVDAAARSDAVVILDGLDEANDSRLIDDLHELASTNVRVVVAARTLVDRDVDGWLRALGWRDANVIELGPLTRPAVAELFDDPERAAEAMRVTGGDPLDLEIFLGAGHADHLATVTRELPIEHEAILAALSCAVAPITPSLLARVVAENIPNVQVEHVHEALNAAGRVVVRNASGGVSWAHPRLAYATLERLSSADAAACYQAFASVVRAELARLLGGGEPDEVTPYVVAGARDHLTRAGASIEELDGLITPGWLAVWESVERGASGFLADLIALWERVDAEQAAGWSDANATLQLRYAALSRLLDGSESTVDAAARAEAVRLGVRSQRAAIASLAAITDAWQHAQAVRQLLGVLDDHGFDLLLATVTEASSRSAPRWPVAEIMSRLLALGLEDEALLWLDGRVGWAAISSAVASLGRLSEGGRTSVLAAIRRGLGGLEGADAMAELVLGAGSLPADERDAWLAHGMTWVANDDKLFWDSYYDERDPRLELAEGFALAGDKLGAQRLLDRALANPYPFADTQPPAGPELAVAVAKCGQALDDDDLRARAVELAGAQLAREGPGSGQAGQPETSFVAALGLLENGVISPGDLEPLIPALGLADAGLLRRAAAIAPSAALATRTLALVADCCEDLTNYGNGYALHAGLLSALGTLASELDEPSRRVALALVWDRIDAEGAPTVQWWHIAHALIPILSCSPDADIAREIMNRAIQTPGLTPPLCAIPAWREVWGEPEQREYLRQLLGARRISRPHDWCELLTTFGKLTQGDVRQQAGAAGVDLALEHKEWKLAAQAAALAGPETWQRVAQIVEDQRESGQSVAWPLAALLNNAPTEQHRVEIARLAWSQPLETSRMGCAGELLAALPEHEAEQVAAALIDKNQLGFVSLSSLPPRASARLVAQRRAKLSLDDGVGQIQFLVDYHDTPNVDVSAERAEAVARLRAHVPAAKTQDLEESTIWYELTLMLRVLELDELSGFEADVVARGSDDLVYAYASRVRELGDEPRYRAVLQRVADRGGVMTMQSLLLSTQDLAELEPFFADEPAYATYPWVIDGIRRRGWAEAFAQRGLLEGVPERLVIWDALWDDLSPDQRHTLWPEVIETLAVDTSGARHSWWPRLDVGERRALWCVERSARSHRSPARRSGLSAAPSEALGLTAAHALALARIIRWFVPDQRLP